MRDRNLTDLLTHLGVIALLAVVAAIAFLAARMACRALDASITLRAQ